MEQIWQHESSTISASNQSNARGPGINNDLQIPTLDVMHIYVEVDPHKRQLVFRSEAEVIVSRITDQAPPIRALCCSESLPALSRAIMVVYPGLWRMRSHPGTYSGIAAKPKHKRKH